MYNFIDLFAGIGGFHLALAKNGMKCVFASEIDAHARSTYLANHSIAEKNFNTDIRSISPSEIPEHDILCAGFPCQPFSQAGHKKGFDDGDNSERGNLFYCILDILEEKKPKAFILENVRHLLKHDNGKTFNIIYDSLTKAGYTVDFKIIKASEFGRPQHRPRIYIVGFNKELVNTESPFLFPKEIPLKLTMSDIWEGQCNRDIGFTLRVGGRGSAITDRRNWDSYLVNGKITRLSPKQGKRMMGLPDTFIMPVTETQQMKQLGNSVCVDVIYHISKAVKEYLDLNIKKEGNCMSQKLNKGEWSEIYAFFKLIIDNILPFGDSIGEPTSECITIFRIKHNQDNAVYDIKDGILTKLNTSGEVILETPILQLLSHEQINIIWKYIMNRDGSSFDTPIINDLLTQLDIQQFKGNSTEKADLRIGFKHNNISYPLDPVGIKSYAGALPTLLNASSATNFIYRVTGFKGDIDKVNKISSRSKIRDRITQITENGGALSFSSCEKPTHENNLRKIDTSMPEFLAEILLKFYSGSGNQLKDLVTDEQKICRFKDYLKAILLGMFPSTHWDGNYSSNGTIVVQSDGDLMLYHVIHDGILKEYLFNKAKLDTPSSTRHRFGKLYKQNGELFIKLNLQIRHQE